MTIKLTRKRNFNKVANHPLQTWEWGEFRKAWGNEVVQFAFGQIILHKVPFTNFEIGTFLKGPKPTQKMLDDLKKIGKEKNLIFIKLEPNVVTTVDGERWMVNSDKKTKNEHTTHHTPSTNHSRKKLIQLLRKNGCVPGKTLFTPTTFWIDLTKSEDELMKSFGSKTRYNIRLAEKRGVKVIEDLPADRHGNSDKAFKKYLQLMKKTVERQGFYAHSEKYHILMWRYLHKNPKIQKSKTPIARLLIAKYKGEIITTWIVFIWKDFLYYPYGASSDKYKNVMANNLMMWEAIKFGKDKGCKTFDLWGREPGKGFTRFKEGYNPQVVEFLGSWDLVTSPLYYPYRLAESIRWPLLRLKSKFSCPKF